MYTLPASKHSLIAPVFKAWKYNIRVNSVLEGNTKGLIFVDNPAAPATAFVWSQCDMFIIGGTADNADFNRNFETMIKDRVIPRVKETGMNYLAIQPFTVSDWEHRLQELLPSVKLEKNNEHQFTFNQNDFEAYVLNKKLPDDFLLEKIDAELLKKESSRVLLEEILKSWPSLEKFLEKGIGYCMQKEDEILGRCFSRQVAGKEHNIDIATYKEEFLNMGIATTLAVAFIRDCLKNNQLPLWKADESNARSIKIAEKIGYTKDFMQPDFYFFF